MRLFTSAAVLLSLLLPAPATVAAADCPPILEHEERLLHSSERINLCERFAGRPLLIVNTASHCGFTGQFSSLEALHQRYGERGLGILGVPSDSFNQAARDEEAAARVCYVNYGVTFPMLSTQVVRGSDAHPLFRALAQEVGEPRWNFNKFLLDGEGRVVRRFDSTTAPLSDELTRAVETLLGGSADAGRR